MNQQDNINSQTDDSIEDDGQDNTDAFVEQQTQNPKKTLDQLFKNSKFSKCTKLIFFIILFVQVVYVIQFFSTFQKLHQSVFEVQELKDDKQIMKNILKKDDNIYIYAYVQKGQEKHVLIDQKQVKYNLDFEKNTLKSNITLPIMDILSEPIMELTLEIYSDNKKLIKSIQQPLAGDNFIFDMVYITLLLDENAYKINETQKDLDKDKKQLYRYFFQGYIDKIKEKKKVQDDGQTKYIPLALLAGEFNDINNISEMFYDLKEDVLLDIVNQEESSESQNELLQYLDKIPQDAKFTLMVEFDILSYVIYIQDRLSMGIDEYSVQISFSEIKDYVKIFQKLQFGTQFILFVLFLGFQLSSNPFVQFMSVRFLRNLNEKNNFGISQISLVTYLVMNIVNVAVFSQSDSQYNQLMFYPQCFQIFVLIWITKKIASIGLSADFPFLYAQSKSKYYDKFLQKHDKKGFMIMIKIWAGIFSIIIAFVYLNGVHLEEYVQEEIETSTKQEELIQEVQILLQVSLEIFAKFFTYLFLIPQIYLNHIMGTDIFLPKTFVLIKWLQHIGEIYTIYISFQTFENFGVSRLFDGSDLAQNIFVNIVMLIMYSYCIYQMFTLNGKNNKIIKKILAEQQKEEEKQKKD